MSKEEKSLWLKKLDKALDEVRPHLAVDGGNIEVVDLTEDMGVKVRWLGTCESCSMSAMTLKAGVEQTIRNRFPEITHIVPVNGIKHN